MTTASPADAGPLSFCMVTTFYPPYHFGGDAIHVHRLSQALAARGHRVTVVHSKDAHSLSGRAPAAAIESHPSVRVHTIESAWPRLATLAVHQTGSPGPYRRELRSILEGSRFDVIHFHNVSLMGGPDVLRLGSAVKLYTTHEYWLVCPMHVLFAYDGAACTRRRCVRCSLWSGRPPQAWRYGSHLGDCLRSLDAILSPSRFALERHRAEGIAAPLEHLPCFVEAPAENGGGPEPPGRPYFLYVGRLERLKGVLELVELFRSYREAGLVVVGAGSLDGDIRRLAAGAPHVHVAGAHPPQALSRLYAGALALVAPSLCYETFGLSVAEAFAHGTPAIVRDIGALGEIARDTGGGLLFHTPEELRGCLERLRLDPALRSQLGEQGRQAARRDFAEGVHVERYLAIVRRLTAARAGSRDTVAAR